MHYHVKTVTTTPDYMLVSTEQTIIRNDAKIKLKQLLSIRKIKLLLTTKTDSHTHTIKNTKNLNRFKSNFPKDNSTINTASSTNKPTD